MQKLNNVDINHSFHQNFITVKYVQNIYNSCPAGDMS